MIELDPPNIHIPSEAFDFENPQLDIVEFSKTLVKTMRDENGLGLAAPQLGVNLRIFAVRSDPNFVFVNPKIVWSSPETIVLEEGCLSYPSIFIKVTRPRNIRVRYSEPNGNIVTKLFEDLSARIIQHEYDHLEGITMLDRANLIHREKAMRQLKKIRRSMK